MKPAGPTGYHIDTPSEGGSLPRLRELTKAIYLAMLTTVDPEASLQSRPMGAQGIDDDGCLWFLGESAARVSDVQQEQEMDAAYSHPFRPLDFGIRYGNPRARRRAAAGTLESARISVVST